MKLLLPKLRNSICLSSKLYFCLIKTFAWKKKNKTIVAAFLTTAGLKTKKNGIKIPHIVVTYKLSPHMARWTYISVVSTYFEVFYLCWSVYSTCCTSFLLQLTITIIKHDACISECGFISWQLSKLHFINICLQKEAAIQGSHWKHSEFPYDILKGSSADCLWLHNI